MPWPHPWRGGVTSIGMASPQLGDQAKSCCFAARWHFSAKERSTSLAFSRASSCSEKTWYVFGRVTLAVPIDIAWYLLIISLCHTKLIDLGIYHYRVRYSPHKSTFWYNMLLGFQEQAIDSFSVCGNMPANRIWIDIYIYNWLCIFCLSWYWMIWLFGYIKNALTTRSM